MKIPAQRHFIVVFGSASLAILLVGWNWNRILSARLTSQALLAFAGVFLLTWPSLILSRLLCEVLRECISAQCSQSGESAVIAGGWFRGKSAGRS